MRLSASCHRTIRAHEHESVLASASEVESTEGEAPGFCMIPPGVVPQIMPLEPSLQIAISRPLIALGKVAVRRPDTGVVTLGCSAASGNVQPVEARPPEVAPLSKCRILRTARRWVYAHE